MFRACRSITIIAVVMFLMTPSLAEAELLNLIHPRLGFSYERFYISNIPDFLRTVSEYNRSHLSHQLSGSTGGGIFMLSLGVGINLIDRVKISLDGAWLESYHGGRSTWSEIGFISDDYLGYRYHGTCLDLSASILVRKFPSLEEIFNNFQGGIYLKGGMRFNNCMLSSGSDAWNKFDAQHHLDVHGRSYSAGIGLSWIACTVELLYSDNFDQNPRIQSYSINFRLCEPFKKRRKIEQRIRP